MFCMTRMGVMPGLLLMEGRIESFNVEPIMPDRPDHQIFVGLQAHALEACETRSRSLSPANNDVSYFPQTTYVTRHTYSFLRSIPNDASEPQPCCPGIATAYYGQMLADDLEYDLPAELIATTPATPRDSARLLVIDRESGKLSHHRVSDLPKLGVFKPGDLMLVNRSRVLPAYYHATRTDTGGRIKGLYLGENTEGRWRTMIEARGSLQPGERIDLDGQSQLTLISSEGGGEWIAQYTGQDDTLTLLSRIGAAPPAAVHP